MLPYLYFPFLFADTDYWITKNRDSNVAVSRRAAESGRLKCLVCP